MNTPLLPLSDVDELRINHDRLRAENLALHAEVATLRQIRDAAQYVQGAPECAGEDRDCEEYFDANGDPLPKVVWCSHVEHRNATYGDVYIREQLEQLIGEALALLKKPSADTAANVRELIHTTIYSLASDGESPVTIEPTREPYKTVAEEEYIDGVLTSIETQEKR